MIIAENPRTAIPLLPFSRDQYCGINLEMPNRIIRDILRSPIPAYLTIATEKDPTYLFRGSSQRELLEFCQYGA